MSLFVATHPVVANKITILRDKRTTPLDFRLILKEITFYLGYEATRNVQLKDRVVTTPLKMEYTGSAIKDDIAIIPVLRAGLTMADGLMELLPEAAVHHIGMYRAKESLLPIQYYNRLPRNKNCDLAIVVDPCIASANTLNAVVSILKRWGAKKIIVIAAVGAREGIDRLLKLHPTLEIHIGSVDDCLNESGMILPGIGDAGDRQYGTMDVTPDLMPIDPLSPLKKRKAGDDEDADKADV